MRSALLTQKIREATRVGRMALGLYLIPGFPDWSTSQAAAREAVRLGVDFIEFPILVDLGWSLRTGDTIARCLRIACHDTQHWVTLLAGWLEFGCPRVAVVYPSAWPEPSRWEAPIEVLSRTTALLLESDVEDFQTRADQAARWGLALIGTADGLYPHVGSQEAQRLARAGGFVYLSLGPRTGERCAATDVSAVKLAALRSIRSDLPVCCAFGLRTPDDVRAIGRQTGCDGVIVGSAALEALEQGLEQFVRWLSEMTKALRHGICR